MRVVGLPRPLYQLAKTARGALTPEGQERMRWVCCWQTLRQQGLSGTAAAQALGLPRSTLYRWQKALRAKVRPAFVPRAGVLEGCGVRRGASSCRGDTGGGLDCGCTGVEGAVSTLGQGQACCSAETPGVAGVHLHDGSNTDPSESSGSTQRAAAIRRIGAQACPSAPLCGA